MVVAATLSVTLNRAMGVRMQVFNFGSINVDQIYRVPHLVAAGETLASVSLTTVLGGKGANQSVALARGGCAVRHIGKLGESDDWARQQMGEASVDVSSVALSAEPSGHAIIQVDDKAENSIILHGGTNQTISREQLTSALQHASKGDWLLVQNECNALDVAFEIALEKGLQIAFNPAPMTQSVLQLPLHRCALLIVNETEARMLADDPDADTAFDKLASRFPDTKLVLTLGSKGARFRYGQIEQSIVAFQVPAVDTTGAGDTFVGYYLASLTLGHDDNVALRRACAAAALSVMVEGATPSIPTQAELEQFLATQ